MKKLVILVASIFSGVLLAQNNTFEKTATIEPNTVVTYSENTSQEYKKLLKLGDDATSVDGFKTANTASMNTAIANLTEAIRLYPNVNDAYFTRGIAYAFNHKNELCITDWEKVKVLDPSSNSIINIMYDGWKISTPFSESESLASSNPNVSHGKWIKDNSGTVYHGDLMDGKPNGKGEVTYADEKIYKGDFVDGKIEGRGYIKYPNQSDFEFYEGAFKDGEFYGKGMLKWKSGESYIGDFVSSKFCGNGVFTNLNGSFYRGKFKNGNYEGEGVYKLTNAYYAKGAFKNGERIDVKYYNNKNQEITPTAFNEIEKNQVKLISEDTIPKKKSQFFSEIIIPEAYGQQFLSHRFGVNSWNTILMQFSKRFADVLYLLNDTKDLHYTHSYDDDLVTVYNNDNLYERLDSYKVAKTPFGKEIKADINSNAIYDKKNEQSTAHAKRSKGYIDEFLRIKVNNDAPFDLIKNDNCNIVLANYQDDKEIFTLENFNFWKDKEEKQAFYKKMKSDFKDKISDFKDKSESRDQFAASPAELTNVRASYNKDKNIAHVQFDFNIASPQSNIYHLIFEIDFKNKTYKKIGESYFLSSINSDHCIFTSVDSTKKSSLSLKMITFDDKNTETIFDSEFYDKLNKLIDGPKYSLQYLASNKDYIIFNNYNYYYFVNKKTKECEKIRKLTTPGIDLKHYGYEELVWNSDLTKSAYAKSYKLHSSDDDYASCIYIIDWENQSISLLKDADYQIQAINEQIQSNKESEARYQQIQARLSAADDKSKADDASSHICTRCHGTGLSDIHVTTSNSSTTRTTTYTTNSFGNTTVDFSSSNSSSPGQSSSYYPCSACNGTGHE